MVTELHLIRHGKTLANEKKLYCGQTDLPLSESGAEELISLKNQGIYPSWPRMCDGLFFTSGLIRTEQTADIICGNVHRTAAPDIAEFKFGLFEMQSYDELKDREDYQAWITDETGDFQCPGGESKNQFVKRIVDAFNSILDQAGDCSAVAVCHGGTIACIMEYLYPNEKNFYGWQPKPGRGYTLVYESRRLKLYRTI